MFAGESQVIVCAVNRYMFFYFFTKSIADFVENLFVACGTQSIIGKVYMHARTIPIRIAKRFTMPIYSDAVFFPDSFQQVSRNPCLITGSFCSFGKNLKFP